jgi:predicted NAD/FAD-binding protein
MSSTSPARMGIPTHQATLTYHMNRLQALETVEELFVTLNNEQGIDPEKIIARFSYSHPVFNSSAIKAQKRRSEIQGKRNTYFCGAYWGYGFHEDGVQSALDVCRDLGSVTRSSSKGTASSYDLQPSSPTSLGGSQ